MLRVGQLDQHLVLAKGQPDYDDCIAVAKVPPMPRQVVDGNMQMADPRRYAERLAPSTGKMRKFSTRYGMRTAPWANGPISGGSTSLGAGSFSMATSGVLALWVKAGALLRPFNPSLGLWRDNDTVSAQARRLSRSSPATESRGCNFADQ